MRLKDKIAIVVGAGQRPARAWATAAPRCCASPRKARSVLAVDRELASAEETAAMVRKEGGDCVAFEADVTREATLAAMVEAARSAGAASTSCTTTSA